MQYSTLRNLLEYHPQVLFGKTHRCFNIANLQSDLDFFSYNHQTWDNLWVGYNYDIDPVLLYSLVEEGNTEQLRRDLDLFSVLGNGGIELPMLSIEFNKFHLFDFLERHGSFSNLQRLYREGKTINEPSFMVHTSHTESKQLSMRELDFLFTTFRDVPGDRRGIGQDNYKVKDEKTHKRDDTFSPNFQLNVNGHVGYLIEAKEVVDGRQPKKDEKQTTALTRFASMLNILFLDMVYSKENGKTKVHDLTPAEYKDELERSLNGV